MHFVMKPPKATILPRFNDSSTQVKILLYVLFQIIFGPRVCPMGSIVMALVRLSVFKYLRDCTLVFSETLHEVRGQLIKKSDTAEILKKNLNPGIKGD